MAVVLLILDGIAAVLVVLGILQCWRMHQDNKSLEKFLNREDD